MNIEFQVEGDAAERIRDLASAPLASARRELIHQAGIQCLQAIVEANPVETGRSRSAWVAALEQLGGSAPAGGEADGTVGVSEGRGQGQAELADDGQISHVKASNQVSYVPYLEYGTSKMAPFAMVRKSLLQLRTTLASLFRLR